MTETGDVRTKKVICPNTNGGGSRLWDWFEPTGMRSCGHRMVSRKKRESYLALWSRVNRKQWDHIMSKVYSGELTSNRGWRRLRIVHVPNGDERRPII
ncbi:hypothetical protein NL676_036004 [Syzygium grande]|nr:hypothetical protein NL676_036004 [Syzygium grande]